MSLSRARRFSRLLAPLALMLLVAFLASCSSGKAATTTSAAAGTTGTSATASVTVTTGGSVASTTTQVASGSTVTPPSTPGGSTVTPPSTPGGSTVTPPSPGGASSNVTNLPGLKKAVKDNPNSLDALGQLAVGYYQAKDYANAEQTYKKMLGLKNSAETHNNLGNVYRDWSKTDQAIEQYQTAISLDPTLVHPYSNLAALYTMAGDTQKAIQVVQSGIQKTTGAAQQQLQSLLNSLK